MYAHLAVHFPKPEHAADLLASMHRVDAAAAGAPGLVQFGVWRDEGSGRLVGLALWEPAEAFAASAEQIFAVVEDDPFDLWCERPPYVFHRHSPERVRAGTALSGFSGHSPERVFAGQRAPRQPEAGWRGGLVPG